MDTGTMITISDQQIDTLINDMAEVYGYDFSGYSRASLKRRLLRLVSVDRFHDFEQLRTRIRNDENYFSHAVEEISVTVTEMLRDPSFYQTIRNEVIPVLATYPY